MSSVRFVLLTIIFSAGLTAAQNNPVPFIGTPLVPMSTAPGGSEFTLTVNGTGFVTGSLVNWNGSPLPTTYVSRAKLTAQVSASDIAVPTTGWITVSNPAPGGGTSNVGFLPVASPVATSSFVVKSAGVQTTWLTAVATGDFNGDGKLDIAVPSSLGITVALGNGDGTFTLQKTSLPIVPITTPLIVADFNGDGKLDLATGTYVMLGNGDGTFQQPVQIPLSYPVPQSVVVALDTRGAGVMDLVGYVSIYYVQHQYYEAFTAGWLNNGNGTFASPIVLWNNFAIFNASAADMNNDGYPDILDRSTTSLLNDGTGTFSPVNSKIGIQATADYSTVADFNGDGNQDMVYVGCVGYCPQDNSLYALAGKGDGTFSSIPYTLPWPTAAPIINGDFNGDGKLDFATGHFLFQGNGDLTFQTPTSVAPTGPILLAGDFNNDGRLDLITADQQGYMSVLLQLPLPNDFLLTSSSANSQTLVPGQTATYNLSLTPGKGFNQSVSFSCSGAPTGASCSVNPNSALLDGLHPATARVQITTTALSSGFQSHVSGGPSGSTLLFAFALTGLTGLAVVLALDRRQQFGRWSLLPTLLCLLCLGVGMIGCGGSGNTSGGGGSSSSGTPTPQGTYTITVTGTSPSGSHSVNFTLTVL